MRKKAKRRVRHSRVKHLVGMILVLAIGSVAAYKGYRTKQVLAEYQSRMNELNTKIEEEQKRTEEIEEYKEYVTTDEYVEEVARDKLGLVYDDEVLLKANEEE